MPRVRAKSHSHESHVLLVSLKIDATFKIIIRLKFNGDLSQIQ
jgi:hypothetical protein